MRDPAPPSAVEQSGDDPCLEGEIVRNPLPTRRYRASRPLLRLLQIGLDVSPGELQTYEPDTKDIAIAQAMLEGHAGAPAVADFLAGEDGLPRMDRREVRERLLNPVRCAWLSAQIISAIPHMMGPLYAQLFWRAFQGDQAAARLVISRFDQKYRPTSRHETVAANIDVKLYDDAQLQHALLERLQKMIGAPGVGSGPVGRPVDGGPTQKSDP